MKRFHVLVLLGAVASATAGGQAPRPRTATPYGSNAAAAATFVHDDVRLYYEVYGSGEPLLIVHENGGSIADMAAQIDYFRQRYKVIAMDSRDQGKSAFSPQKLTYETMTDDLAALLDHLHSGPVYVLGWSDGAIEALLLGIRHPDKVKKIAAMAANMNPSDRALHPETLALIKKTVAGMPASPKTPQQRRDLEVTRMMLQEPNIPMTALQKITAPTLVLGSDHDLIRDEHTVDIFHHIPNSQLAIFPNAKHTIPYEDPATFNATVDRFFRTPFMKIDRVPDTMKVFDRMHAAPAAR
jgi:pimeloyl-ACP methyl ester carboxylesterase